MIVNLTPHPIRIYGWQVPDRFNVGDFEPIQIFEPSGDVARIAQNELGTWYPAGAEVPVERVEYSSVYGLPAPEGEDFHIVSLPTALAAALSGRRNLLVPFREVRNLEGTVIGCRSLASLA